MSGGAYSHTYWPASSGGMVTVTVRTPWMLNAVLGPKACYLYDGSLRTRFG